MHSRKQREIIAVLVLSAVRIYAALLGIEALARSSSVIFVVFIVMLILILSGTVSRIEMSNIVMGKSSLIEMVLEDFSRSGEITAVCVLVGMANKKAKQGFLAM